MAERYDTSFFWLKRIKSLFGIFPLTFYMIFYFIMASTVLAGPGYFDKILGFYYSFPLTTPIEIVFVAIPLLMYIMLQLVLIYRSSANVVSYPYYQNWIYFLFGLSGFFASIFIVFHVWSLRIIPFVSGGGISFAAVQSFLAPLWVKIFYITGMMALIIHVSMGLPQALKYWGVARGRRSQFAFSIISWLFAVFMAAWTARLLIAFT